MPAPAPAARKVKVREVSTGQILEVWPVDAREYVKTPDFTYVTEASAAEAAAPAPPPPPPKSVREQLGEKSYKELQAIAKKAGFDANQKKDDLVEQIAVHVEAGAVSLEELTPLSLPQAQFPNATASE